MENAVHLVGVRCDGSAHGGCQAGCLIFWKDAWLRRVDAPSAAQTNLQIASVRTLQLVVGLEHFREGERCATPALK
jgi:hypothetical protein